VDIELRNTSRLSGPGMGPTPRRS